MDRSKPTGGMAARRGAAFVLFVALLLTPAALRLRHPSLYADDVMRIAQVRDIASPGAFLMAPCNEHVAPLFQCVTAATWEAGGESLTRAPLAFSLAAVVPHLLLLIALAAFVRRELDSPTAGLIASALLGLSPLITETFAWYSASSFSWALLGTVIALDAAGRSLTASRRRGWWLAVSALAAMLAPAFSGIGLLAGPLAALRLAAEGRLRGAIAPPIGTAAYLAAVWPFRFGSAVGESLARNVDVGAAVRNVASAPADVLLPGLIGRRSLQGVLPDAVAVVIGGAFLLGLLVWAARDRARRPLIATGLGLVLGGYLLAFGARSAPGLGVPRDVQRYQLFPMAGVAILIVAVGVRFLRRFDAAPDRSWTAATLASALLLLISWSPIRDHARFYRWPDQPRTLAAMERLAALCRREGITRPQCLRALDAVRTRWFDFDLNALLMMPPGADGSREEAEARSRLLASLDRDDRAALFGGMGVSRHLTPTPDRGDAVPARLVKSFEMAEAGPPGRWRSAGWASFLEYEIPPGTEPRALALPVDGPVEVWWSGDGRKWSESRSIRWDAPRSEGAVERALPLDALPHWDAAEARHLRIAPRRSGVVTAGAPRLIR